MNYGIKLRIWGERACFTRPEMKSERVSYDVITPSAARGVLEAVYWKPSIRWNIDRIHVMNPIKFENIRRNELASKLPFTNVTGAMKSSMVNEFREGKTMLPFTDRSGAKRKNAKELQVFIEDDRQQRAAMILRDVEYIIEAHFEALDEDGKNNGKHLDIFNRRAIKGQCFNQPYLGCREFPSAFELVEGEVSASRIEGEQDLGWMLFDMHFSNLDKKGIREITPMFFHPKMINGVIDVPSVDSLEVKL